MRLKDKESNKKADEEYNARVKEEKKVEEETHIGTSKELDK